MLARLAPLLREVCKLHKQQPILLAMSGGPDSLCMLDLLGKLEYPLIIAHLDHQLRPTSKSEAAVVQEAALKAGAPFVLGQENVRSIAKEHGMSIEEAAREARYKFLFAQAEEHNAQAVAVGHTANDQVETVLMHLLRGAGLAGLMGMEFHSLPNSWSQDIPLVRPLLATWREEVLTYLKEKNLEPIIDESNTDQRYFRNRLRHELIPYLESYNPRLRQSLWRMADILKQDHAALKTLVDTAWEACVSQVLPDAIAIYIPCLQVQPVGVQRRLIRRAIGHLRPDLRNIDFNSIQRGLEFLNKPSQSRQIDLVAGLRLFIEGDNLWLSEWSADPPGESWPQMHSEVGINLDIPGKIPLPGGWQIQAEIVALSEESRQQIFTNLDKFQAWLDLDALQLPMKIRPHQPGDRFQPLGMQGSLKLSDFLINVKLPQRARDGWPLALSGGQIAWVPGFQLGHPYQVSEQTRKAVHIYLRKEKP